MRFGNSRFPILTIHRKRYGETVCSIEAGTEESICFAGQSSSGHPVFWLEYIHLAEQYGAMMSYARGEQTVVELGVHGEESFFQLPIPYRMEQKQNGLITEYRLKKEGTDPISMRFFSGFPSACIHLTR